MTSQGASPGRCWLRGRVDRLGTLDQAGDDRPEADRAETGDLPGGRGAGSRDALLRRLEQLPRGHPSAVRAGASGDRPAPARQEAAHDREAAADGRDSSRTDGPTAGCETAADGPDSPTTDIPSAGGQERGEKPAAPGAQPEKGPDGPGPPGGPQPDHPDRPAIPFVDRVEHFESLWKAHLERWPEPAEGPGAADRARPDDPTGSWRGAGDRYLAPEQNADADRIIELLRRPEKAVTELLQKIQQDNPYGGYLVGLDHRLKGTDRLKEKIVEHLESEVGSTATDAASEINDAVRYTSCFGPGEYVDGHGYVHRMLESAGCEMTYSENHWIENPQYKGINSRWETPGGGRFELQFHTQESFYAKEQLTHRSYNRLRSPDTSWDELPELEAYQCTVSGALPEPAGIAAIPRREERI